MLSVIFQKWETSNFVLEKQCIILTTLGLSTPPTWTKVKDRGNFLNMNVHPDPFFMPSSPPQSGGTTVVIAAYNEAKTIGQVITGVRKHTPALVDIIVVDDGSVDGTAEQAKAAGAIVTRLPENRGKGIALRKGLEQVSTEFVLTIDGDGQDDPSEIPNLVEQMKSQVDMVIGSRFLGTFYKQAIKPINKIGNLTLTWLFDKLYRVTLTDTQAGFRLFRAKSFDGSTLNS